MEEHGGSFPSDDEIRNKMEALIEGVDLETMSTKQFIAALSQQFGGVDMSSKKKFIKASITDIIDSMEKKKGGDDESDDDEEVEASEEESEEEEEVKPKPKKKRKSAGGGGGGGLTAVKEISDDLASLLSCGNQMARTAVVKGLWVYIKENGLQNPEDKREILLDERMKAVFGVDRFTMFQMNKYVGAHIHPFKPVDLTAPSAASAAKRKAKGDAKGRAKAKKGKGPPKKQGTQAPYRLSDALAAVVKKTILPRPQVTQGLWAYIRENNLQNPSDKREIICDDLLRPVMGGEDKVTMFSMNKHISPHMLEKLDKSEYVHEEVETPKVESESEVKEEDESGEEFPC